ncbi:SDR family NAD(P)-dependent oxidoreductase [Novosphingobium sp. FSY-8]|uniref:SDR family NAD(P)-dependent oxidoreductase n=1 Tax=Novosphingobium ovatum TaxID=1908523 RepID=A0ABW9XAA8_9SPHN|nr:SDR family NAD(P)-dependent oxidoreductase [Novosphingobium ovatum]NBC35456.1 SDR family NAD(P)-dependent oxidoreductase [Novosphingobium ovatum]
MSAQAPIASPFTASSTAQEVIAGIDLSGKCAVVTGGYAGLGLETVRVLRLAGAQVIVPARDLEKARRNLADMPDVRIEPLDLMDPTSIDDFAGRVLADHPTLDLLINNAGTMAGPLLRDGRGYESQFSTNVLGHFHLTCRLWPALTAAQGARVVALSSANHHADIAALLHDPNFARRPYDPWQAYAQSKAATALFAVALDALGRSKGVRAYPVHPGGIFETDLARHMDPAIAEAYGMIDKEGRPIIAPEKGWKNSQQGAATTIWAATSPMLAAIGGVYCADCNISALVEPGNQALTTNAVSPSVIDQVSAGRLWQICEQLSGVALD